MASEATVRPDVQHLSGAPQSERDLTEKVMGCGLAFERGIGVDFKERCERFYRQYRGFKRFRNQWEKAGPNDKDGLLLDSKKAWGANLHVPLSFRTIETKVPRAIAHRPRMLYLPRQERWAHNVMNVRLLIDSQQDNIDIDLPFQSVMRSGMIYGIGFGKTFWRREYALERRARRRMFSNGYKPGPLKQTCVFDDPDFEDLDVFDVMWDPFGSSIRSCGWLIHRSWLSLEACLDRVASGAWNTETAKALTEDKLRSMGTSNKFDEVWSERMTASGFSSFNLSVRGEQIHELWEWHDGHRVHSVLDRQALVQDAENQCVGQKPFMAYRPTPLAKQMVGIGELEPIEHLNRELDTMRSQQLDAATIALCAGYAYDDAAIDEDDLVFGPASAIRVQNSARVQDAIMPLPVRDVPASSVQHQQIVRQDIEAVSGLQDALDPSSGGQIATATQAQLVQAALSKRIELQSRRFEIEVVRNAARCFLKLNQRMILDDRDPIRLPDDGYDAAQAAAEGRWKWFPIGPGELQGEFEIIPEGGSMAAENVPQMRQDAVQIMNLFGQHPDIDPRRPLTKALELFGIRDPDAWLKQQAPPVPPKALEILSRIVDPRLVQRAVQEAQRADPQLPPEQQGPNVGQVDQMMAA